MIGGRLGFTLTLSDFGVTSFDFIVLSLHGDDSDATPEYGAYNYPDPGGTGRRSPRSSSTSTALLPKAGKTFTVPAPQVKLTTGDIVAADSITVTLTYKGQALKPRRQWAWKIPKTYKGKHLVLKVAATYQGEHDDDLAAGRLRGRARQRRFPPGTRGRPPGGPSP